MKGVITGKDVFLNSLTIVRLFGLPAFLACAWAALSRRRSTFLGVLYPAPVHASGHGALAPRRGRALP